jgi:preprotein translocase subunit SecG
MLQTFIDIIHIGACLILMFVVLLQQGKGGGMGAAFGGGGAAQVFGGRGAGNILTRATTVCAAIFMITSVTLAYLSSSRDRGLERAVQAHQQKMSTQGTPRALDDGTKKKDDAKDKGDSKDMKDPSPQDEKKPEPQKP